MKKGKDLILVFVRNPELGKVKTRLAKTMGDEKALNVYYDLLKQTKKITATLAEDKAIFYSHFIDDYDLWDAHVYQKFVQEGTDLGDRMKNAFQLAFQKGYERVIIIGSDCLDLTKNIIEEAFFHLHQQDVVIGPAFDGGYYLLGMNQLHPAFFENKVWSKENVFLDTLLDVEQQNLSFKILDTLSDIDYEKDLDNHKEMMG